jgi:hypothetical protein
MPQSKRKRQPSLWLTMVGTSVSTTAGLWYYALHVRGGEFAILLPLVATPAVIVGGFIVGALLYVARIGVRNVVPGATPNVGESESSTREIVTAQAERGCRCAAVASGAALIPAFIAVRWVSRTPAAWLLVLLGVGVAIAFARLARRLLSPPSDFTLGVATAGGWATAAMLIGTVFALLSFGMIGSKNSHDGLLVSAWPVLFAGGLPGGFAVGMVFGASVELGRSAWRASQRQVFGRPVAQERRDEWRDGAQKVLLSAAIGMLAFVAASSVAVRWTIR